MAFQRASSTTGSAFLTQAGEGRSIAKYKKNEIVFAQGDAAEAIYYIQTGRVKVAIVSAQGKEGVVAILGPNDFFGEGCVAGQTQRASTVVALTECAVLRLEKAAFTRAMRQESLFSLAFIAYLLNRNIRTEADLAGQLFHSSEKRLARLLLQLARAGAEANGDAVIAGVNQETLAEMIGTTRPRVSFFMTKFRKLGFIAYNGGIEVRSSLASVVIAE